MYEQTENRLSETHFHRSGLLYKVERCPFQLRVWCQPSQGNGQCCQCGRSTWQLSLEEGWWSWTPVWKCPLLVVTVPPAWPVCQSPSMSYPGLWQASMGLVVELLDPEKDIWVGQAWFAQVHLKAVLCDFMTSWGPGFALSDWGSHAVIWVAVCPSRSLLNSRWCLVLQHAPGGCAALGSWGFPRASGQWEARPGASTDRQLPDSPSCERAASAQIPCRALCTPGCGIFAHAGSPGSWSFIYRLNDSEKGALRRN